MAEDIELYGYRNFGEVAALRGIVPEDEYRVVLARWARTQAQQQGFAGSDPNGIHLHFHQAPAASPAERGEKDETAGWALLHRLTPYFVIALLFILGMGALAVALMLTVPPFMALVATILSSLVSVVISAVGVVGMVVAFTAALGGVLHNKSGDKAMGKVAGALASVAKEKTK